ncbi:MAG: sugar phosphate isomerase/epimerase, partial [Steroidobacteraceae bacterium]
LGAAALSAAPMVQILSGEPSRTGFFATHKVPIGLQLYMLGDSVRTDLNGSFEKVARMGYRVLEAAGWHGHSPKLLHDAAARHGLKCTSLHVPARSTDGGPQLDGDVGKLAADARALGATDVVLSMFPVPLRLGVPRKDEAIPAYIARVAPQLTVDDWKRTAELLNAKGAALKAQGLRLGYHNHNPEFAPVAGTTGLDVLLSETSPDSVVFELDVGWALASAVDPVALFQRHARRFQLMHVKDLRASTKPNFALRMDPAEIGAGVMNWNKVLSAAWTAGVRKYYVEQEPPFTLDRFEAANRSYRYLSTLGVTTTV